MKIKVYVSFDNCEVMTESQHEAWLNDKASDLKSKPDEVASVLEALDVSAIDIYMMDNEDLDNLHQKVFERIKWDLDDDYDVQEFELEV